MSRSHPPPPLAPPALLAVRALREEIAAGVEHAHIRIRTLDDVSLAVHARELLIVRGTPGDGTSALVRAMADEGSRAAGMREAAPGVRIRRACISEAAAHAIAGSWQRSASAPEPGSAPVGRPVVYLLRVREARSSAQCRADTWLAWHAWAALVRRAGGAVMLVHDALPASRIARADRVQERAAHGQRGGEETTGGAVRTVALLAGRIVCTEPRSEP